MSGVVECQTSVCFKNFDDHMTLRGCACLELWNAKHLCVSRTLMNTYAYLVQHCFFLPLPQGLVGIRNAFATSKKPKTPACIREIQVRKLWSKVYSQKG